MPSCPECSARPAGGTHDCDDLFGRLLAREFADGPLGRWHGITVPCFFLQHPSRQPAASRPFHWATLAWFVRDGLPGVEGWWRRNRERNSHRSGGRRPTVADVPADLPAFPGGPSPTAYRVTIADVATSDLSFPLLGHEQRVVEWAGATVDAWNATSRVPGAGKGTGAAGR